MRCFLLSANSPIATDHWEFQQDTHVVQRNHVLRWAGSQNHYRLSTLVISIRCFYQKNTSVSLLIWACRGGFLLNCSAFRSSQVGLEVSLPVCRLDEGQLWVGSLQKRMTPRGQETHSRVQELGSYNNNSIHNRLIKHICCPKHIDTFGQLCFQSFWLTSKCSNHTETHSQLFAVHQQCPFQQCWGM